MLHQPPLHLYTFKPTLYFALKRNSSNYPDLSFSVNTSVVSTGVYLLWQDKLFPCGSADAWGHLFPPNPFVFLYRCHKTKNSQVSFHRLSTETHKLLLCLKWPGGNCHVSLSHRLPRHTWGRLRLRLHSCWTCLWGCPVQWCPNEQKHCSNWL